MHISNYVTRDFTSNAHTRLAVENGTTIQTAHTHLSLLAVSQIRGVAPRIKIHHSGPLIDKSIKMFRQLETGLRAILRDVQGV
jgi:hypothetical protein